MSITSSNLSRASTSISSYNSHDPKMNVKKFEAHKAFYEPSTDSKMYKQMRRAVRPTMTLFLFARHSDNRFYEDYWYLYPTGKPQDCDYNSILREVIFLIIFFIPCYFLFQLILLPIPTFITIYLSRSVKY